jgi:voltage-gated potassium channel
MDRIGSHFRRRLTTYLVLAFVLMMVAGGAFAAFESRQVSNVAEGVWWALSLITGSGFVGGEPTSLAGRLVAAVLMVSGFSLIALVTAAISSLFVREEQVPEEEAEERFETRALALLAELSERLEALEAAARPGGAPRGDDQDAPGS